MKLLFFFILSASAFAIDLNEALRARLRQTVADIQQRTGVKGISAAVVTEAEVCTMVAGESYANRPITPDMVFGIGSVTKTFTATTLLRMQEEGLIDLDDEIGKWIPNHPHIDPSISIRQLLQHTSGLSDFSQTQEYRAAVLASSIRIFKPEELLQFIKEPLRAKGTGFGYSNTNYVLAGIIMTKVTGKKVFELYREYVKSPIALDSTFMAVEEPIPLEIARRWMGNDDGGGVSLNAAFSGAWTAGAVMSTATESARFMRSLHRLQIIGASALVEMHTYTDTNEYGLGVSRKMLAGNEVFGHSGSIRGYESIVLYIPSVDVGLAVLVNQAPSSPVSVAERLIEVLTQETSVASETASEDLVVAPNPVSDEIGIKGLTRGDQILISDARGCAVEFLHTSSDTQANLDVRALPTGLYRLIVRRPTGWVSKTVVIQR